MQTLLKHPCSGRRLIADIFIVIAPMLDNGVFPMKCLIDTAREIDPDRPCKEKGQYIEAVLRKLSIARGNQQVAEMWREANLDWGLFLQHSDIDPFIKQNVS